MKRLNTKTCVAAAALVTMAAFGAHGEDLTRYADLFTGTAGTGHTHPAACVPFGMVQAGPDTGYGNWHYCSGYQFADAHVFGYSLTHLSGTGCPDYGDVSLLPFTGELGTLPRKTAIDKKSERATPGYYCVTEPEEGVTVEIAPAKRAAIYRLTWQKGGRAKVLLNLPFGQNCRKTCAANVKIVGKDRVEGTYERTGWIRQRRLAFALAFDRAWVSAEKLPQTQKDAAPRYVFSFDVKAGEETFLRIGLAMTDAEGASRNLAADMPTFDFNGARTAAKAHWQAMFVRSTCEGNAVEKTNWYTALYHLYSQPNDYADVDGRFCGADGKIAQSVDGTYMTTLSLWDTFRAAQPLYTILSPEIVVPVVNSLLSHYKTFGRVPVMSYGGKNIDCMVGNHGIPVIVDAYLKGFAFDTALAFEAITNTLTVAHPGKPKENWDVYDKYGYYPYDLIRGESVSRTLECCYGDWCTALFARKLGHAAAAEHFAKRAEAWKRVIDPTIGFARGKDTKGAWRDPFDPYAFGHGSENNNDFTEGNAFQYTWHVMQDAQGLVDMLGGREAFVKKLDGLFVAADTLPDAKLRTKTVLLDISGLIGQYVHGNEPSHHVIYFYPQVGHPEKAAARVRDVFDKFYFPGPTGLCGNDDCGQMSAWYLFSAMGFYPFNPCGGEYIIGAPQLPRMTLALTNGKTLNIVAKGLSKENKFVKSVTLNGRPITDWKIRHADILAGGELVYEMGK